MANEKELESKAKKVADGYDKVMKEYNGQVIYSITKNDKDEQMYEDNYIWTYYDDIHEYFTTYYTTQNKSKRLERLNAAYQRYTKRKNANNQQAKNNPAPQNNQQVQNGQAQQNSQQLQNSQQGQNNSVAQSNQQVQNGQVAQNSQQLQNSQQGQNNSVAQSNQQGQNNPVAQKKKLSATEVFDEFSQEMQLKDKEPPVKVEAGTWKFVSKERINEIRKMCQWIYRHYNDTGIGGHTQMFFAQKFVLNQPIPIKMVAFYMVENKLDSLKPEDILRIYKEYSPDYDNFRNHVAKSKIHFIDMLTGKRIRWERLENAMQVAIQSTPIINQIGKMETNAIEEEQAKLNNPSQNQASNNASNNSNPSNSNLNNSNLNNSSLNNSNLNNSNLNNSSLNNSNLNNSNLCNSNANNVIDEQLIKEAAQNSKATFEQLLNKLIAYKKLEEEINSATTQQTKTQKQQQLDALKEEITKIVNDSQKKIAFFRDIINSEDKGINEETETMDKVGNGLGWVDSSLNNLVTVESDARNYIKELNESKSEEGLAGLLKKLFEKYDIDKILEKYENIAGKIFSLLGGVTGVVEVITFVMDAVNFWNSISQITVMENVSTATELTSGVVSLSSNIMGAVEAIKDSFFALEETAEATETITNLTKATGITLAIAGGISAGKGIFDLAKINRQNKVKNEALDSINSNISAKIAVNSSNNNNSNNNNNANAVNNNSNSNNVNAVNVALLKEKKIIENIDAQYKRGAGKKKFSAIANVLTGGLDVAGGVVIATGVAFPIGTVALGISLGLKFITWAVNRYKKKVAYKEIIDKYIDMDIIYQKVKDNMLNGVADKATLEKKIDANKSNIKRQIRYEIAAKEGCSNPEKFMQFILKKYALFLYNKVFYDDKNKLIHKGRNNFKDLTKDGTESYMYRNFLKGYGIRAAYPKDENDDPYPDAVTIATQIKY